MHATTVQTHLYCNQMCNARDSRDACNVAESTVWSRIASCIHARIMLRRRLHSGPLHACYA